MLPFRDENDFSLLAPEAVSSRVDKLTTLCGLPLSAQTEQSHSLTVDLPKSGLCHLK